MFQNFYLAVSNIYFMTLRVGSHIQSWLPAEICFPGDLAVNGFLVI